MESRSSTHDHQLTIINSHVFVLDEHSSVHPVARSECLFLQVQGLGKTLNSRSVSISYGLYLVTSKFCWYVMPDRAQRLG